MEKQEFRDALDELGLSQIDFSRETGVSLPTVHRWATGARIPPLAVRYIRLRLKIAEALPTRRKK